MLNEIKNPIIKKIILDKDINIMIGLVANAKVIGFNEQLNIILEEYFFGENKHE
jgi:hypothetical protein